MKEILRIFDNIIKVNYTLAIFDSAKDLSNKLKANYKKHGIDYTIFNSEFDKENSSFDDDIKNVITNPPQEIYEYQNFFLMDNGNGDYVLLDGFRRLLWYSAPDVPIYVRIYHRNDLSDQQILSLLVNLNHFKFFGGGTYHDRGFALLLNSVFNLNIQDYRDAFNGYLTLNKEKMDYGQEWGLTNNMKNLSVKDRILNPLFVSDIQFLETIRNHSGMVNKYMGILTHKERQKSNKAFDSTLFLKLQNENKVLKDLLVRQAKLNTNEESRQRTIINQIIDMYINIFTEMAGGDTEKSYAELLQDAKNECTKLKKDKKYIKLTGNKSTHKIEPIMTKIFKKGESLNFKIVVYPFSGEKLDDDLIISGVFDNVYFKRFFTQKFWMAQEEFELEFKSEKGHTYRIYHNYGGYNSYSKKYTKAILAGNNIKRQISMDIDLFVELDSNLIEK